MTKLVSRYIISLNICHENMCFLSASLHVPFQPFPVNADE